jgi:hypothetical protein
MLCDFMTHSGESSKWLLYIVRSKVEWRQTYSPQPAKLRLIRPWTDCRYVPSASPGLRPVTTLYRAILATFTQQTLHFLRTYFNKSELRDIWHRVRVVKEVDSKSIMLCMRRFKSCRCRLQKFQTFYVHFWYASKLRFYGFCSSLQFQARPGTLPALVCLFSNWYSDVLQARACKGQILLTTMLNNGSFLHLSHT